MDPHCEVGEQISAFGGVFHTALKTIYEISFEEDVSGIKWNP